MRKLSLLFDPFILLFCSLTNWFFSDNFKFTPDSLISFRIIFICKINQPTFQVKFLSFISYTEDLLSHFLFLIFHFSFLILKPPPAL